MSEEEDVEFINVPLKEYESLLEQAAWLSALENAGVDNWEGVDFARDIFREENPEYADD